MIPRHLLSKSPLNPEGTSIPSLPEHGGSDAHRYLPMDPQPAVLEEDEEDEF